MLGTVFAVVYNVPPPTRQTGSVCQGASILIFSRFANGTGCGGVQKFLSKRAIFAIIERLMFGAVLAVVYNVSSYTR